MVKNKFKSNNVIRLILIMVFLFVGPVVAQDVLTIIEVAGKVTNASGEAIEGAIVKAVGTDVSAVLTDAEGRYKFYLAGQEDFFTLQISKGGYRVKSSPPLNPDVPRGKVTFEATLEAIESPPIQVDMEEFISGASISGKVTGLKARKVEDHKVLVYVLTNQWYIHPYAENKDGTGYASIKPDGSWRIQTVNRKHHPYNLAILVVPRTYVPPSVISIGEDAMQSLLARIGSNLTSFQIIPAPEGL